MIAATHLDRQAPERWLDRLYPMPRECRSADDWHRARNRDIPELADADLDRERFRLSARIAHDPDRHRRAWLAERRDLVAREQRLRQRVAS